ncbi:putative damage-inducible protein DinB [Peteryoungia aggregata LMG 23059]|uniref:Damage-inducible protein DinB n=1 Tax=Peteryoungia aggregata LMG 23059 TaxID=1368425 RepID=A0ABU0G9K6_9HYPH|nr:DinB family protein [Peteryoungia aggregata]MDQ0421763.1 putative damage-inducible protein DinB [Peteryoungia aggregata LMG 23059]
MQNYQMLAAYNAWANRLLYAAAAELSDEELHKDTGAFFGSTFATLSHIMTADRVWLNRFTGEGPKPKTLDERPYERFEELRAARGEEDQRIIRYTQDLTPERLESDLTYTPVTTPELITQKLWPALTHFFNHQTHHRGQVHAGLTAMGKPSLALDLIYFVRSEGKAWQ